MGLKKTFLDDQSGIYKITCYGNNKGYIGQGQKILERLHDHIRELKINKHKNKHFQRSYNKYGPKTFEYEALAICEDEKKRKQLEIQFIAEYGRENLFNKTDGGEGFLGYVHTKEDIAKTNETKRIRKELGMYDEFFERHSKTMKRHSAEQKLNKEGIFAQASRDKQVEARKRNGTFGMFSDEGRASISKNATINGKKLMLDPAHKKKCTVKLLESTERRKRRVESICPKTGLITEYSSAPDASKLTGVQRGHISSCCNGSRQTAGGLHWQHLDGEEINDVKKKPLKGRPLKSIDETTGAIIEYVSRAEAATLTGLARKDISACCEGKIVSLDGKRWEYLYEDALKYKINKGAYVSVMSIDIKTGEIKEYEKIKDAIAATGIRQVMITACCKGERESAGGFYWQYLPEQLPTDNT